MNPRNTQKLSIVVPMYNEARHIVRTLDSAMTAAACAGLECELIVVDNGSHDNGPLLAQQAGARVLCCPGLSIGALRNRGAAAASGHWLAFLDADIEVPVQWLLLCKRAFRNQEADVLALDCAAPPDAPWFARAWQRRSLSGNRQPRLLTWLPTPNLFMEHALFERVGGFDETLRTGEDKDLGLRLNRAGARQLSLAQPVVKHWGYEGSWREWTGKEFWRQSSHVQLLIQSGAPLRLLSFPLMCLVTWLMSLLALLSLLGGHPAPALKLLLLSLLPSLLLAGRQSLSHRAPLFSLQLWLLHWMRLHLGGVAFLCSLFNRTVSRPDRG